MINNLIGNLLIATPVVCEEPFYRSVILVCSHDNNHAMGLVINKKYNNLSFKALCKEIGISYSNRTKSIMIGGPIEITRGFVIHSFENDNSFSYKINGDFSLSSNIKVIKDIANNKGPKKSSIIMGYSGWTAGQLEKEIKNNSWLSIPATDDLVFSEDYNSTWISSLDKLGIDPLKFTAQYGNA